MVWEAGGADVGTVAGNPFYSLSRSPGRPRGSRGLAGVRRNETPLSGTPAEPLL